MILEVFNNYTTIIYKKIVQKTTIINYLNTIYLTINKINKLKFYAFKLRVDVAINSDD